MKVMAIGSYVHQENHAGRVTGQKTAGCFTTPASPRAWAACWAVRRPRGDATPPTPRWLVRGNSVRRSLHHGMWKRKVLNYRNIGIAV